MSETRKSIRKFPPCPYYDIERTESWLSDMSAEGWELEPEGFNLIFAHFQKNETPRRLEYRMQAAPADEVYPRDSIGDPKQEAVEMSRELGWHYISRRDQFYIYAAPEGTARELNTDTSIQAFSLRHCQWWTIFWLIYDLRFLFSALLLALSFVAAPLTRLVHNNILYILATIFLLICGLVMLPRPFLYVRKLRKKLQQGIPPDHNADWKRKKKGYYALWITIAVLVVFTFGYDLALNFGWHQRDIDNYQKEVPFVVLQDMTEEQVSHKNWWKESLKEMQQANPNFQSFSPSMYDGFDSTVEAWFSPVTPVNYHWSEKGKIYGEDGTITAESDLFVTYHKAWTPGLARALAEEYRALSGSEESAFDMGLTGMDFVHGYYDELQQQVLIVQHGNIVIKAYMYNSGICTFQEWVDAMAARLSE